jgi:hypothetical protein
MNNPVFPAPFSLSYISCTISYTLHQRM